MTGPSFSQPASSKEMKGEWDYGKKWSLGCEGRCVGRRGEVPLLATRKTCPKVGGQETDSNRAQLEQAKVGENQITNFLVNDG